MPSPDEARHRQALQQIGKALRKLTELELSFLKAAPAPTPLPWPVERLRDIQYEMNAAYDLLAHLTEPKDLLDEMADL